MDISKASPAVKSQILELLPGLIRNIHDDDLHAALAARDLSTVVARLEVLRKTASSDGIDGLLAPMAYDFIERCITP